MFRSTSYLTSNREMTHWMLLTAKAPMLTQLKNQPISANFNPAFW